MYKLGFILFLLLTVISIHANQNEIVDIKYEKIKLKKTTHRYYLIDNQNSSLGYYEIGYNGNKRKKNIIVNDFTIKLFQGKGNTDILKEHYLNVRKISKYTKILIVSWTAIFLGGVVVGVGGILTLQKIIPVIVDAYKYTQVFLGIGLFFGVVMAVVGIAAILIPTIFSVVFGIRIIKLQKQNYQIIDELLYQLNNKNGAEITIFNKKL